VLGNIIQTAALDFKIDLIDRRPKILATSWRTFLRVEEMSKSFSAKYGEKGLKEDA
jgi:hypothetical protein